MTSDPYHVLGLDRHADAAAIRARYLELVRRHPPEQDPQRFGEIRAAYDRLRDPIVSLEHRLLSPTATQSFDSLQKELRPDIRKQRLPTEILLSLGRS